MDLNLLRVFDFYLAMMVCISLYRRWGLYRDGVMLTLGFVVRRWPRLLHRLNQYKSEAINRTTLRPLLLTVLLMVVQLFASRLLFPQAKVSVRDLSKSWWQLTLLILAAVPMLLVDFYFILRVGRFDRAETIKYFDRAETWAGTWRARAVRIITLGRVNPDRMVDSQVREGLRQLGATFAWAMWWVSTQLAFRLIFGLTLWMLWYIQQWSST